MEYQKDKEHNEIEDKLKMQGTLVDLKKYPMGTALNLKIDWFATGLIDSEGWDNIALRTVAEKIGKGQVPMPEDFEIKT
jgi:hypothetical protein